MNREDDINNLKVDITIYLHNPIIINNEFKKLLNFDEIENESNPEALLNYYIKIRKIKSVAEWKKERSACF
jgi:hypothetical protein